VQEDVQLRHELKRLRYETKRILVQRDRRKEEYDKVILQEQLVSQNG
jgi:cell division protein FtsL